MAAANDRSTGQCTNNECFDIVKSQKTYTVPCTKNVREAYTVKVPKIKAVTVNKQVPYMEYEPRIKHVPYQYLDYRPVVQNVPTCRSFPARNTCGRPVRSACRSVARRPRIARAFNVRRKCPRTAYIKKSCYQPRQFCQSIPRTGWRTVQENVPVQKFRTQTELQYRTEEVPEVRYRTRPVTKMVKKTIPVYNIVPKPPATPGKERILQTMRAPEEKPVLPAATTYRGAVHTPFVPAYVADVNSDSRIYRAEYPVSRETGDLNYSRYAGSGVPGNDGRLHTGYGTYTRNPAFDFVPVNEAEEQSLRQAERLSERKLTSQPEANERLQNFTDYGYRTGIKTEPLYDPNVPLELGKDTVEYTVQTTEEKDKAEATTADNVAAKDPLIPRGVSGITRDGRMSMNVYSAPRQASASGGTAYYRDQPSQQRGRTGVNNTDNDRIEKNLDGKLGYQGVAFGSAEANKDGRPRSNNYGDRYGTNKPSR